MAVNIRDFDFDAFARLFANLKSEVGNCRLVLEFGFCHKSRLSALNFESFFESSDSVILLNSTTEFPMLNGICLETELGSSAQSQDSVFGVMFREPCHINAEIGSIGMAFFGFANTKTGHGRLNAALKIVSSFKQFGSFSFSNADETDVRHAFADENSNKQLAVYQTDLSVNSFQAIYEGGIDEEADLDSLFPNKQHKQHKQRNGFWSKAEKNEQGFELASQWLRVKQLDFSSLRRLGVSVEAWGRCQPPAFHGKLLSVTSGSNNWDFLERLVAPVDRQLEDTGWEVAQKLSCRQLLAVGIYTSRK